MTTPNPEIIRAAASRIAGDVRRTPLWTGLVQPAAHDRVAVILCGANLDPASLA